jgi:hypothetical protein
VCGVVVCCDLLSCAVLLRGVSCFVVLCVCVLLCCVFVFSLIMCRIGVFHFSPGPGDISERDAGSSGEFKRYPIQVRTRRHR